MSVKALIPLLFLFIFFNQVKAACEDNWLVKKRIENNTEIVEKYYCDFGCSELLNGCKMNEFFGLIASIIITALSFLLIQTLEYPFSLYINIISVAFFVVLVASDIFGSVARLVIIGSTLALVVQIMIIVLRRMRL